MRFWDTPRRQRGLVSFCRAWRLFKIGGLGVWIVGLESRVLGVWFRYVQRFLGGLVFEVHRLCALLISRLESNEEEEKFGFGFRSLCEAPTLPF